MNALELKPEMSSAEFIHWVIEDLGWDMDKNIKNHKQFIIRQIFYVNDLMNIPIHYETKQASLQIVECQVKKPCDYIKLIKLTVGECCTVPIYGEPARNLPKCTSDNKCIERGRTFHYLNYVVTENPYFFNISSNADGCELNIEYKSYNFDENGYPIVDLTYREAITAYIRWKNIIRMRGAGKGALAGYTSGDEREARLQFASWAGMNRARKRMDAITEDMIDQISAKWLDPFYVPTNQWQRQVIQQNTLHIHS